MNSEIYIVYTIYVIIKYIQENSQRGNIISTSLRSYPPTPTLTVLVCFGKHLFRDAVVRRNRNGFFIY